jgi:hypothetical protein
MAQASRDQNYVTTLLAVSSVDGVTPVTLYANPITHRLLVDLAGGGSGTVQTISVATANGFAGTSDGNPNNPTLTLTTSITGILKGNGTAISAAVSGTDIKTVNGTSLLGSGNITVSTSPGGSTTQLQYNNAGAFGGISGATTDGTNVTLDAPLISTSIRPSTNDGAPLGSTTNQFSDLFLASGAVVNFDNGNINLTHSPGALTMTGGTLTAPQFSPSGTSPTGNRFYLPAANTLGFSTNGVGRVQIDTASLSPITSDGLTLGSTSLQWSDLFLASGAELNIANGNWVATHTTGILTVGTGDLRVTTAGTNTASVVTVGGTQTLTNKTLTSPVISNIASNAITLGTGTFTTLTFDAGATDPVITAASGSLTVSTGDLLVTTAGTANTSVLTRTGTQTVTNKRPQPRTASSTSASTLTPDLSSANVYFRTTQTTTLTIDAPIGTPVIGETIAIYVDSAAAQTLTINSIYKPFGTAFPATTTAGKTFMMTAQFNGTDWKTLWANAI